MPRTPEWAAGWRRSTRRALKAEKQGKQKESAVITQEQNELLTRVEGDAPMGLLMRENYWIPALVSSQLEADGAPARVRLLGRNYVAFRATDGRIGFFDEGCPHRGTSLVLARNEECGLRCIFHGWKIDVSGSVVDVPTHSPNPEAFAAKVPVGHYQTHEGGGIVWVWLGSREAPPFPELPFTLLPASRVWVTITKAYCNWLQGVEATLDTAHIGTLHSSYLSAGGPSTIQNAVDVLAPRYEVERTTYGLDAAALRPLEDGTTYLRTTKYVMPFISLVPAGEGGMMFIQSPIDDHHHNVFYGIWSPTRDINDGDGERMPSMMGRAVGEKPYDPHNYGGFSGTAEDNWGQDREAMKAGHFSGMLGNLLQEDMVTQASMGAIVDRTREHLSSSDVAIIHARRMLLDALADVSEGRVPVGAATGIDHREVMPVDTLLPAGAA
jgi:phthalate 4,5-dioxygenase oxygenase subunit